MSLTFVDWLMKQTGRYDDVGTIAQDVEQDRMTGCMPKKLYEPEQISKHMSRHNVTVETYARLDKARQEYTAWLTRSA